MKRVFHDALNQPSLTGDTATFLSLQMVLVLLKKSESTKFIVLYSCTLQKSLSAPCNQQCVFKKGKA